MKKVKPRIPFHLGVLIENIRHIETHEITCARCATTQVQARTNTITFVRFLLSEGWGFECPHSITPLCPNCLDKKKKSPHEEETLT